MRSTSMMAPVGPLHVVAQHPVDVGDVLDERAHPGEPGGAGRAVRSCRRSQASSKSTQPTTARIESLASASPEHVLGLVHARPRPGRRPSRRPPLRREGRLEVRGAVAAVQERLVPRHPVVAAPQGAPSSAGGRRFSRCRLHASARPCAGFGFNRSPIGASARISPSGLEIVPEGGRDVRARPPPGCSPPPAPACPPGIVETTQGCRSGNRSAA